MAKVGEFAENNPQVNQTVLPVGVGYVCSLSSVLSVHSRNSSII